MQFLFRYARKSGDHGAGNSADGGGDEPEASAEKDREFRDAVRFVRSFGCSIFDPSVLHKLDGLYDATAGGGGGLPGDGPVFGADPAAPQPAGAAPPSPQQGAASSASYPVVFQNIPSSSGSGGGSGGTRAGLAALLPSSHSGGGGGAGKGPAAGETPAELREEYIVTLAQELRRKCCFVVLLVILFFGLIALAAVTIAALAYGDSADGTKRGVSKPPKQ